MKMKRNKRKKRNVRREQGVKKGCNSSKYVNHTHTRARAHTTGCSSCFHVASCSTGRSLSALKNKQTYANHLGRQGWYRVRDEEQSVQRRRRDVFSHVGAVSIDCFATTVITERVRQHCAMLDDRRTVIVRIPRDWNAE